MKSMAIKNILLLHFLLNLVIFGTISAQTIKAPIDAQVDLIPKILALDKNFNPSYEKKICNIGIIYDSQLKNSSDAMERIMWYWSGKEVRIKNSRSRMMPIDITKVKSMRETFDKNKIKAVYIAPLKNYNISSLTKICKDKKIRTFTGVDSLFTDDISVLFDLNNYHLQIFINQKSAEGEGINFSAYLLNIAELKE
jgi:hypothetical protein